MRIVPGKPVGCNSSLLSINCGLLWGKVASDYGLLGFLPDSMLGYIPEGVRVPFKGVWGSVLGRYEAGLELV